MWNNQLSTSLKFIDDAQLHGINFLIPDTYKYCAPGGEDALPSKIKVNHTRTGLTALRREQKNKPAGPV